MRWLSSIRGSRCLPASAAIAAFIVMTWITGIGSSVPASAYEVWITDQSDTGKESGGYLYIYDGAKLAADPATTKPTTTIDFSGDINTLCEEATKKPVRRPHMLFFTTDQAHVIVSFLSGHALVMDAGTKKPETCLNLGKNLHAAWPTPDQKMALAANMAEKKLIRIWTDYPGHKFGFDPDKDVLNLGALDSGERPDNAPVCPVTDDSSTYGFVTLRGGGLFVVDVKSTPMKIITMANNVDVHPAGCGGIQVGGTMYLNSGGGVPANPLAYDVYAIDMSALPKSIGIKLVTSRDNQFADSHGMAAVGRYLWSADRAGNNIEIIDTVSNLSVNGINLVGSASDDPTPDLLAVAPDGSYVFVGTRGPTPLSGNVKDVNNAKGSTPGVGVIKVTDGGKGGELIGIARISNMKDGKEAADSHGIGVRK
ncbi:MAG TPA: hypothetical protein VHQ67_01060 [Nitrospiraceae bacterium]|nr:hypothetical protein [Nitrospiraceae bacterium]